MAGEGGAGWSAARSRWVEQLEQACLRLKDEEVTVERLQQIACNLGDAYMDRWYGWGSTPDHYADNYPMWIDVSRRRMYGELLEVNDPRVIRLLARPSDKQYWRRYSDDELVPMMKMIPEYAQRRGNLITISQGRHGFFVIQCAMALEFIRQHMKSRGPREFAPSTMMTVYWWELDEEPRFFVFRQPVDFENEAEGEVRREIGTRVIGATDRKTAMGTEDGTISEAGSLAAHYA